MSTSKPTCPLLVTLCVLNCACMSHRSAAEMFGGINFKQLSERFNESLHDLESTLAHAATATGSGSQQNTPTRQQPTRSSTSPAAGAASASASPSRSRPRPAIDPQARSQSASSSSAAPLSPTSLAQASQSASQLADSALSSLRASLRKGRQSLESAAAARTSLDKSAPGASASAAVIPAASERPTPVQEEPAAKEGDTPNVGKAADSSASSSTSAAGIQKAESTAASESNDAKTTPAVTSPPQESAPEETIASIAGAAPVEEKNTEEDLLGPLANDPAPTVETADSDKVEPVFTTTASDSVPSSVEPSAAFASPPTSSLSPEEDEIPIPALAVCPPAPPSHTSPISSLSPMAYEAPGEEDDADDWGMGSISPAPESEGFVDLPRTAQTPAATAEPAVVVPENAAESSEPAAREPTTALPDEEAPASGEVQEEKKEEDASAEPSLESEASSQPAAELDESSLDKPVDATTPSMEESAKGPEATPEEVAAPPPREEVDASDASPVVTDATETHSSASEQLALVGSDLSDEAAANASEEQAAPETKATVLSDPVRTDSTAETVELLDAAQTAEPESQSELAVQPSISDEGAHAAAPTSETVDNTSPELAEASPPAAVEDEINSPEELETEQPSDDFAPSEPLAPAAAVLDAPEEVKVDAPATAESTVLLPEEDPIVPLRPAEEPVATSPNLAPEVEKLSTTSILEPASDPSPESDAVSEAPNQMLTQAVEPAEEKDAETTEEKVETPMTELVGEKADERAVEKSDEKVRETAEEKADEQVNETAEEKMQATSLPEEQTALEAIVPSAPHLADAQQGDVEVLPAEPPKLPTGKVDKPKGTTPTKLTDGEI